MMTLIGLFACVLSLTGNSSTSPSLRHYTTQEGADGIREDSGLIQPSGDGITYLTHDIFFSGQVAQDRLSLRRRPVGYFSISTHTLRGLQFRGPVKPDNGGGGGGSEYVVPGPVSIGGARFVPIGP